VCLVDRSSSSRLGSSLRIIRQIARHEGGLAAFYRGLGPNLVGNSTGWALYFLCYGSLKDIAGRYRARDGDAGLGPLTSSDYFLTSGIAGMFSTFSEPRPLIKA
jgi:solute carrier family 25 folate transporter 32